MTGRHTGSGGAHRLARVRKVTADWWIKFTAWTGLASALIGVAGLVIAYLALAFAADWPPFPPPHSHPRAASRPAPLRVGARSSPSPTATARPARPAAPDLTEQLQDALLPVSTWPGAQPQPGFPVTSRTDAADIQGICGSAVPGVSAAAATVIADNHAPQLFGEIIYTFDSPAAATQYLAEDRAAVLGHPGPCTSSLPTPVGTTYYTSSGGTAAGQPPACAPGTYLGARQAITAAPGAPPIARGFRAEARCGPATVLIVGVFTLAAQAPASQQAANADLALAAARLPADVARHRP